MVKLWKTIIWASSPWCMVMTIRVLYRVYKNRAKIFLLFKQNWFISTFRENFILSCEHFFLPNWVIYISGFLPDWIRIDMETKTEAWNDIGKDRINFSKMEYLLRIQLPKEPNRLFIKQTPNKYFLSNPD